MLGKNNAESDKELRMTTLLVQKLKTIIIEKVKRERIH